MITIIGWKLYPVNTSDKTIVFSAFVLFTGAITFIVVRKAGYKVLCEVCRVDIFPFIDLGNTSRNKVGFCPLCGEKLDRNEDR